jgi:hypothetical protein
MPGVWCAAGARDRSGGGGKGGEQEQRVANNCRPGQRQSRRVRSLEGGSGGIGAVVEGSGGGGGGGVGDDDEVGDEMDGGEERGRIARYDQRERERVARKQSTAADGVTGSRPSLLKRQRLRPMRAIACKPSTKPNRLSAAVFAIILCSCIIYHQSRCRRCRLVPQKAMIIMSSSTALLTFSSQPLLPQCHFHSRPPSLDHYRSQIYAAPKPIPYCRRRVRLAHSSPFSADS